MKLLWLHHLRVAFIAIIGSSVTLTLISGCSQAEAPQGETLLSETISPAPQEEKPASETVSPTPQVQVPTSELILPAEDDILPKSLQELNPVWTGDFEGMVKRRLIRALVVYSQRFYFIDAGVQRGIAYEQLVQFEQAVNKKLGTGNLKVQVLIIPVSRKNLIPALLAGYGDIALGNLTITPERQKLVDFSEPVYRDVKEILVTGPSAPPINSLNELPGQEISVRKSSSYYDHLVQLNQSFTAEGKPPIELKLVSELLEDEDLLEMVNAGMIPAIIVDSNKAQFWAQIFKKIVLRPDLAVHTGGQIGWAFRPNSPRLREVLKDFLQSQKQGTLMGNIFLKRYLRDTLWVKNATSGGEIGKLEPLAKYFQKYGQQYNFDWLLLAAQAYQESQFKQNLRSSAGAIGIMQVLPSTAADPNVNIPNITNTENNIHAGTKYLRFIADNYFNAPGLDQFNRTLFCFAAYNAGPNRMAKLRSRTAGAGLDPNKWFNNVERVVAAQVGRETVQYVTNIFQYYLAFRGVSELYERKSTEQVNQN